MGFLKSSLPRATLIERACSNELSNFKSSSVANSVHPSKPSFYLKIFFVCPLINFIFLSSLHRMQINSPPVINYKYVLKIYANWQNIWYYSAIGLTNQMSFSNGIPIIPQNSTQSMVLIYSRHIPIGDKEKAERDTVKWYADHAASTKQLWWSTSWVGEDCSGGDGAVVLIK